MARKISGGENADDASEQQQQQLPEVNEKSEQILRNLIHQQLDEIRTGNAYVEHELQPDCFSKLLVDNDAYSKFETMTAKKWMNVDMMANNESGLNGGKLNKKRKQYVSTIKAASGFVRREIELYTASHESPHADEHRHQGSNRHHTGEEDTVSSLSESKVSSSSTKRKKKSKKHKKKKAKEKKKSRRSKKRKRDQDSEDASDIDDNEPKKKSLVDKGKARRAELKAKFEAEKRKVLALVPEVVKNNFRDVGFAKWGKEVLPVMFLGPFDVAPGDVRETWMNMQKKTKKNRTPMSRLVFWYGTSEEDMTNAFSFLPAAKTMTYEEGCNAGYNKIPLKIQKKIDKGKSLSTSDTLIMNGLEEISKDWKLPVEERQPWLFDFEEEYEENEDEENEEEEEEEDLHSELSDEEEKQIVVPKKKIKKNTNTKDSSKEVPKKKTKRKRQSDDKSEGSKSKHSRKLDEEIMEEVAQEDAFLKEQEEEVPSEDDKLDDDFSVEDEEDDESDGEEELYEEKQIEKPKKTKPEKEIKQSKKSKGGKGAKLDKANTIKPKKKGKTTDPFQEEQKKFEDCERIFLPLMMKLKEDNLEDEAAEKSLKKIYRDVKILIPSFIEQYQIGLSIKYVRNRYKSNNKMNQLCKSITSSMKIVYKDKIKSAPDGFKPKIKKQVQKKRVTKQAEVLTREKQTVSSVSPKRKEDEKTTQEVASKKLTIPKKGSSVVVEKNIPEVKTPKVEKVKPSVQKYSLINLLVKPKAPSNNGPDKERKEKILKDRSRSTPNIEEAKLPRWITSYNPICGKAFEASVDRELAMDFLNDAVACLPKGKIDPQSIANALEDALFTKYESAADAYWDRIHVICAALVGKKKMGHLGQKIIAGDYATPLDVINIPEKTLFQSFEGHWIA